MDSICLYLARTGRADADLFIEFYGTEVGIPMMQAWRLGTTTPLALDKWCKEHLL